MCYRSPGPRCSGHALATLEAKTEAFEEVKTDPSKAFDAYHEMKEAEERFRATPKGMLRLSSQIATTSDPEARYELEEKLRVADRTRYDQLIALRDAYPNAILEEEDAKRFNEGPSAGELEAAEELKKLTSYSRVGEDDNFEKVSQILREHPSLYAATMRNAQNLRDAERFALAKEHDDAPNTINHMSYSYAPANPEELRALVAGCRAQLRGDSFDRSGDFEYAYRQGTFLMARNADTPEKMDEFLANDYPHDVVQPTAMSHVIWQGKLTPAQSARFLGDILEKGSSFQDYRNARGQLLNNRNISSESLSGSSGYGPVPKEMSTQDLKVVKNPVLMFSTNREDKERLAMAQARLDATEEGFSRLQSQLRASLFKDDAVTAKLKERISQAEEYQRAWWQIKEAKDTL